MLSAPHERGKKKRPTPGPRQTIPYFQEVGSIVHAGDWCGSWAAVAVLSLRHTALLTPVAARTHVKASGYVLNTWHCNCLPPQYVVAITFLIFNTPTTLKTQPYREDVLTQCVARVLYYSGCRTTGAQYQMTLSHTNILGTARYRQVSQARICSHISDIV